MAIIASNTSEVAGKWVPYYYKPFRLGRIGDGLTSTDGNIYITQTNGSGGPLNNGLCFSSHNCGFYYIVTITNTSTDAFSVKKYDLNDNLIDTIEASAGYDWDAGTVGLYTIDIGVGIYLNSGTSGSINDTYKITLPSVDTMKRRRIYHGGYATFMKIPEFEAISYHSDIIPCDLKGKNITVSINPPIYPSTGVIAKQLLFAHSEEDSIGNRAISALLEWNTNPQGGHSNVAVAAYAWHADETWALGSLAIYDIDPNMDFPQHAHLPASDVSPALDTTGTSQAANVTMSGRAGHAKIRLEYEEGTGSSAMQANNQFLPIILTIG
tara:strand:+ start:549 stop:1520 length:972 start_codon:yes stop_codon:yes gene_type:complete